MKPKIAVCFFGITRSLSHTIASIERNVLDPARNSGNVTIYSHFFLQRDLVNRRSGEKGHLDLGEHRLLPSSFLHLEEPDACLEEHDFERLKAAGDAWQDDFQSLRNLVHQLHSMNVVAAAALEGGAEVCLFCRPDLAYHDSLSRPIHRAVAARKPTVFLPRWEPHGGYNDRFAICAGTEAIIAYGQRIRCLHDFCAETGRPLHSEQLLAFSLARAEVSVRKITSRASRVRLDGTQMYEDFAHPWVASVKAGIRPPATRLAEKMQLRQTVRRLLQKTRP